MKVFKQLSVVVDSSSDEKAAREAAADAVKRVGSKSALGVFLSDALIPKCSIGVFSKAHVTALMKVVTGTSNFEMELESDLIESAHWIAEIVAREFCESCEDSVDALAAVLVAEESQSTIILQTTLKIVHETADKLRFSPQQNTQIREALVDMCASSLNIVTAKLAAKGLAKVLGDDPKLEVWNDVLGSLSDALLKINQRKPVAAAQFNALAKLATRIPNTFYAICGWSCFDYLVELLRNDSDEYVEKRQQWLRVNAVKEESKSQKKRKRSVSKENANAWDWQAAIGALRLLLNSIIAACISNKSLNTSETSPVFVEEGVPRAQQFLRLCVDIVGVEGDVLGRFEEEGMEDERAEDAGCSMLRLAAATSVLKLCRHRELRGKVEWRDILSIMLTTQDALPDIRLKFAEKLTHGILSRRLTPFWLCALVFMAIDPDRQNLISARSMCSQIVVCIRAKIKQSNSDGKARVNLTREPESLLPYVIWLVANHPDIEVDAQNELSESQAYLSFFFDILLDSSDYATYLVQILQTILMTTDAREGNESDLVLRDAAKRYTARLHLVAECAMNILKQKSSGKRWDLSEFNGKIPLPSGMYSNGSSSKRRVDEMKVNDDASKRQKVTKEWLASSARHAIDSSSNLDVIQKKSSESVHSETPNVQDKMNVERKHEDLKGDFVNTNKKTKQYVELDDGLSPPRKGDKFLGSTERRKANKRSRGSALNDIGENEREKIVKKSATKLSRELLEKENLENSKTPPEDSVNAVKVLPQVLTGSTTASGYALRRSGRSRPSSSGVPK
uniref:Uncharacterized protein n=1 Tax=Timspurckia oligopyrenoides TaxID=708627 RepID=A0A7S0ZHT4_9RHOD